jgi:hypothetical protein
MTRERTSDYLRSDHYKGDYEFEKVAIDLSSSIELRTRLDSFRRRATDLGNFIRSQKWGTHTIHVDRSDENRPKVDGTLPSELVLEALYRRFRFFILNDENANYLRFVRLLSASSDDELLHSFLRVERKDFFQSGSLDFAFITSSTKYRPDEVIDIWFNAYYFHDERVEREKLATLESIVSAEGAKVLLWESVWNGARRVRNLAWLTREAIPENPVVYVPIICWL